MTDGTRELFQFPSFDRRKIEASFTGGDVSGDGGIFLLRQADRRLGLIAKAEHTAQGSNPRFVVTNLEGEVSPRPAQRPEKITQKA